MPDTDDFHFELRNKKLLEAVLDGVKKLIKDAISPLNNKLDHVYNSLVKAGRINPLAESQSPKKLTERGYELLKKHDVDSYLISNCELLKDKKIEKLKSKTDWEIFMECCNWVNGKGNKKNLS